MPELWSNPVAVRNCAASVAPETSRSDQRLLRAGARSDYLPALDGLRCLAFLGVLLNHVRVPDGLPLMHIASERGSIGVELFFVLSSYLLFSLFRVEFEETGRISVSNFFVRRLLRL
ncbi:MAG TPA: acyltransferase family protein, partial [Xanthobacteraceae bacterium]